MKKLFSIALAAAIAASVIPAAFAQDVEPTVKVDGRTLMFIEDQPPVILNDRTYVPLRRVLENMGATVDWNDETKTVKIDSYDNIKRIYLTIDNPEVTVYTFTSVVNADKETITSDVAPVIMNDRAMLPIRVIAEALGATVNWDDDEKLTEIITEQAKYYASTKEIDTSAEDFSVTEAVGADLPKLSLVRESEDAVKAGDTVTLKLKADNLEAEGETAKISSITLGILYSDADFAFDTFRCISDNGEISPALSANNPEFAKGCLKLVTLSLPENAYSPAEDGTIMELDFTALSSNGGKFAISDAVSELGSNTHLIIALDSENYYSIAEYDELYINTAPVTVAAADGE